MIVRIRVLSDFDISQSRIPQDGAFEIQLGVKRLAFRASTMPTIYGQKAVLRPLGAPGQQSSPKLSTVGFSNSIRYAVERGIARPNGILFCCGPTGNGKITTLYSCLAGINKSDLNITALEDPVEIRPPSITQHQVNHGIGLSFERLLRGVLRQDPDVVLFGEIRDGETATIATEAALTGHLVLSSLHTNDSIQAITPYSNSASPRTWSRPPSLAFSLNVWCAVSAPPVKKPTRPPGQNLNPTSTIRTLKMFCSIEAKVVPVATGPGFLAAPAFMSIPKSPKRCGI